MSKKKCRHVWEDLGTTPEIPSGTSRWRRCVVCGDQRAYAGVIHEDGTVTWPALEEEIRREFRRRSR